MKRKKIISLILSVSFAFLLSSPAFADAFTDIASNPYVNEINYCQSKGYVAGVSPTTFLPDANLTRGQFAAIWCRFMNYRMDYPFTDITSFTPKNYYDIAAFILYSTKVMNGTDATTFDPNSILTREQVATIAARAEKLAASDPDAYKWYKDYTLISAWATDAISACINNNVLRGLYSADNFEPAKPVTRAEICKLLYNLDNPKHTVSIATLTGGSITASPTTAYAGDTIALTITPDSGKQLKAGTLTYNGNAVSGTAFIMPAADALVSAEFEDVPPSPTPTATPSPTPTETPSPTPTATPSPTPTATPSPT